MANGDAERTIRPSLLERPPGRNPRAPATPSADRPRCPIAPCRASKGLKMLKTTRASYWLELASIWDRRHVRLGSAPPRLRRRYARNDGKRPWKWEQSEPVALAKSRHLVFASRLSVVPSLEVFLSPKCGWPRVPQAPLVGIGRRRGGGGLGPRRCARLQRRRRRDQTR